MNKKILFYSPLAHVIGRTFKKEAQKPTGLSAAASVGPGHQGIPNPPTAEAHAALFDDPQVHLALDHLIQCMGTDTQRP